jgi:hypothetical protein
MLTTKLGHRHATLSLAQDREDLGFAVSRHLHLNFLMHLVEKILLPQPLSFGEDYLRVASLATNGKMPIRLSKIPLNNPPTRPTASATLIPI